MRARTPAERGLSRSRRGHDDPNPKQSEPRLRLQGVSQPRASGAQVVLTTGCLVVRMRAVRLNPETGIPLYRQLADQLSERIHSGKLAVGERIPSEPELAHQLGIGRPTVRQATDLLVRRGLLERRRGSGTYVLGPTEQVDLFTLAGTNAAFEGAGLELATEIVVPTTWVQSLDSQAGPLANTPGFTFCRRSTLARQPVMLEYVALGESAFPGFDRHSLEGQQLSLLIETHYRRKPTGGTQSLSVATLSADEARLLAVDAGTPALLILRRLDFALAPASLYVRIYVLTHLVALTQHLYATASATSQPLSLEHTR